MSAEAAWSGLYRCRVLRAGRQRTFRVAASVQRPDRFRLEVYGPVGGARLLVASDGETLTAALPGERVHAVAPATARSFQVLLGIALEGEDLLALLDGRLLARQQPGSGGHRLTGGGRVQYHEGPGGRVEEAEVWPEGEDLDAAPFQVAYGDFVRTPAGDLPGEVRLSRSDHALVLALKQAHARRPDPTAFRLPIPPGFRSVGLSDLAEVGLVLFGG